MTDETFDGIVYDAVGGRPFFVDLVDGFYAGVSADLLLRPMYPEDLTESRRHLAGFLTQYWGGPSAYSDERGHPRLCGDRADVSGPHSHPAIPKLSVHADDERSKSEYERYNAKYESHEHRSALADLGAVARIVAAPFSIGERSAATHLLAPGRWRRIHGTNFCRDKAKSESTDESNCGYGEQHPG